MNNLLRGATQDWGHSQRKRSQSLHAFFSVDLPFLVFNMTNLAWV
ncbi:hypothetical protein [Scytonema hofmannii]|nr:hypothetical protein [Scytonema hofmannii]